MNRLRSSLALGAISLLAASCQGNDPCAESGTACGGDPTGSWSAVSGCRDPYYKGPDRLTFQFQPETAARDPLPVGTSSDWCSYLVYQGDKITGFQFPYDTPRLGGVAMTFGVDGTYTARITLQVGGQVAIPETCLTRFGVKPICASADPSLASPPRSLTDDLRASVATAGSYQGISCSDAADGGCLCAYSADFDPTVGGNFTASDSVITLYDSNKQLPAQVDFCATGDALTLWGHNRASIWNQVPGVRTVQLVRAAAPAP